MSEQELTQDQLDLQDEVDNACFNFILEMSGEKSEDEGGKVEWDMETIQIIREAAQEVIVDRLKLMTEMEFYPYEEMGSEPEKVAVCPHCGSRDIDHRIFRNLKTKELIEDSEDWYCNGCDKPCIPIFRLPHVCGTCQFANQFCAPPSPGGETDGVECTCEEKINQDIIENGDYGQKSVNLWRAEALDTECDDWQLKDKPDAAPAPQHKIFVVVNKGVVEKVYGPKGSDYVIIDEDTQDEDGEHEVAFRHEELDAAKEAGEVEEL